MQRYVICSAGKFDFKNGTYKGIHVDHVEYRTPKGELCTIAIRDVPELKAEFKKYRHHNGGHGMMLVPHEFSIYHSDVLSVTQFMAFTNKGRTLLGPEILQQWGVQFLVFKSFAVRAGWVKPNQFNGEHDNADVPVQPTPKQKAPEPVSKEMTTEQMVKRFNEIFAIAGDERTEEEKAEMKRLAPIVSEYMKRKLLGQLGNTAN